MNYLIANPYVLALSALVLLMIGLIMGIFLVPMFTVNKKADEHAEFLGHEAMTKGNSDGN